MWVNQARLPSEYQEVEYIGRNGNNYIDTGWIPNLSNQFEVKIGYKISSSGNRYGILSNYNVLNKDVSFEVNTSNKARFFIQDSTPMDLTSSASVSTSSFSDIVFTSSTTTKKVSVDGTEDSLSNNKTGTSGTSAYLFIDRSLRWTTFTQNSFISYCKIYQNGTLVRDFVPCYRKSDNVIGLYDLVNNQFYTNSGSGTFSKGNDVSDMVEKQVYPAGWKPGSNTVMYYPFINDQLDKVGSSSISLAGTNETLGYTFNSNSGIIISNPSTSCKFFSVWIKWNSNNGDYVQGPTTYIGQLLYNYYHINSSTSKKFQYQSGSSSWGKRGTWSPNTGEWHHLAMGFDGTKCFAYVDGVLMGSYNTTSVYTPGEMRLGNMINETVSEFICESVCWTAEEITNYYNQTKSNYGL